MFKKGLTFEDITLVPQFNNIPSRLDPDLSTWLTKDIKLGMPLLAANMDTVINAELAKILIKNRGVALFHRFTTLEQKLQWIKEFNSNCFMSIGVPKENFSDLESENILQFIEAGVNGLVLDIAHAHSLAAIKRLEAIKLKYPSLAVIAGNVCTAMGYMDLVNAGADAIKVGVGPGSACSTRIVTGHGVPQFTAILDCAEMAKKFKVPIIADGGIKNSGDVVKAIAVGASTVMIGNLFAKTLESAAKKVILDGKTYAHYRGQASENFQKDFYGKLKDGTVAEGIDGYIEVTKTAQDVIDELLGGLRSGLTYGGARSIKELQRKAEFIEVTNNYMIESKPRL